IGFAGLKFCIAGYSYYFLSLSCTLSSASSAGINSSCCTLSVSFFFLFPVSISGPFSCCGPSSFSCTASLTSISSLAPFSCPLSQTDDTSSSFFPLSPVLAAGSFFGCGPSSFSCTVSLTSILLLSPFSCLFSLSDDTSALALFTAISCDLEILSSPFLAFKFSL
uniref:Uncharacterized protein n=1 Tax=Ciona intestinalis TaxID=7719 RepID=H2Y1B9_CIOIN